uniref:EG330305 protein n=2 Tax=Mus TaxID=862507 RepID=Q3SXC7_MOUSE|nr:EG330305 protein [Mus musculus]AAI27139.1 EG330305 protein [Mus musculus]
MQDLDLAVSVSFRRSQTSLLTLDLLQLFGASVENFLSSVSTNS